MTHFCYNFKFTIFNFFQIFVEICSSFELILYLFFKFLLTLEVLSYARKRFSLNNVLSG